MMRIVPLFIIILLAMIGFWLGKKYKDVSNETNEVYDNLFYEIYVAKRKTYHCGSIIPDNYYKGRIRTIFPNGKEKTIWETDKCFLSKSKCEEVTKIRYNLLCSYYFKKHKEN